MDTDDPDQFDHGLDAGGWAAVDKKRVRIEVKVPAVSWEQWLKTVPHDAEWAETLRRVAGGAEASRHWYVVPTGIPATQWTRIDVRNAAGEWETVAK